MRRKLALSFLSLSLAAFPAALCYAQAPAAAPAARQPAGPSADEPAGVAAVKGGKSGPRFLQMHESFLKRGKEGNIDLLMLGDSITEGWGKAKDVYQEHYGKYNPANFGIGGDRTQHVLWRIDNGELDGIHPKVVVLMLGTNNVPTNNTADEIFAADKKIIDEIHEKLPETKVLVLAIFPRGHDPKEAKTADYRAKIDAVNKQLAKLDDGKKTRFLDINKVFLQPDGTIAPETMKDYLHPTPAAYKDWADAMQPTLDEMMK